MVLMEVSVFLAGMIRLYQKKYLMAHLINWVQLEYMSVLPNMAVDWWCLMG